MRRSHVGADYSGDVLKWTEFPGAPNVDMKDVGSVIDRIDAREFGSIVAPCGGALGHRISCSCLVESCPIVIVRNARQTNCRYERPYQALPKAPALQGKDSFGRRGLGTVVREGLPRGDHRGYR